MFYFEFTDVLCIYYSCCFPQQYGHELLPVGVERQFIPKTGFTDNSNTVFLTSKLQEVHSCTAHDIVRLGVYTES